MAKSKPSSRSPSNKESIVTFNRRASLRVNSFDVETGTFSAIAATETPVPRSDFFDGDYSEVLSLKPSAVRLARLQSGRAPILDSHKGGSARDQIGVITDARIESSQLIVEGQLSPRDDVKPIATDLAAGVIRNVSIGYRVNASTETNAKGARVITRTDWEPIELSIVTVGADPEAHIRSAKGKSMPKRRNARNAPVVEDDENEIVQDQRREQVEADEDDLDRELQTRSSAAPLRLVSAVQERGLIQIAEQNNIDRAVVVDCIRRGLDPAQCRSAMLDVLATRSDRIQIDNSNSVALRTETGSDGIEAAIGDAIYGRMTGKAPKGRALEFMGRSMLEMGAELLEHRGERVSWRSRDRLASQIMERSAGHTTSDFPTLLANAGNRVLLDAYQATQTPLKLLARRRDAADFRAMSTIRLGEAPKLLEVPQSGEVQHGTRAEAKESFKLKTFARIFGLSRQAIINDDLSAFADTNNAWGKAAADTEADQLVALLTANSGNGVTLDDDDPIYATGRGNKAASGTVIDVTNLGLARKALREAKGLDGKTPISVTPKHLVVGAAKETEAEQALTLLAAAQVSNANPFAGKLTLHVEPRLSGNAWRLFADPAELAVISIAYLNGQTGPLLEARQGFDVLGAEFRCMLDFGCGVEEWRGTYLNPGN